MKIIVILAIIVGIIFGIKHLANTRTKTNTPQTVERTIQPEN